MQSCGLKCLQSCRRKDAIISSSSVVWLLFENEANIDLGGVTVRLMWLGAGHTRGDELILVDPDGTLISGDIVQNKVAPNIPAEGGNSSSWIAVLDKLAAMNVKHVLPDHSQPGDGSMIASERAFITSFRNRTRSCALSKRGRNVESARCRSSCGLCSRVQSCPPISARSRAKTKQIGTYATGVKCPKRGYPLVLEEPGTPAPGSCSSLGARGRLVQY